MGSTYLLLLLLILNSQYTWAWKKFLILVVIKFLFSLVFPICLIRGIYPLGEEADSEAKISKLLNEFLFNIKHNSLKGKNF